MCIRDRSYSLQVTILISKQQHFFRSDTRAKRATRSVSERPINKFRSTAATSKASMSALGHRCCDSAGFHADLVRKIDTVFVHQGYPHPLTHQLSHWICTDLKIDPGEGCVGNCPRLPPCGDATGVNNALNMC